MNIKIDLSTKVSISQGRSLTKSLTCCLLNATLMMAIHEHLSCCTATPTDCKNRRRRGKGKSYVWTSFEHLLLWPAGRRDQTLTILKASLSSVDLSHCLPAPRVFPWFYFQRQEYGMGDTVWQKKNNRQNIPG